MSDQDVKRYDTIAYGDAVRLVEPDDPDDAYLVLATDYDTMKTRLENALDYAMTDLDPEDRAVIRQMLDTP